MTAIEPDLALTTVPSAFRAAVEKYPDNTALEGQGTSLSYRELDRLSNRIANGLLARGGEQPLAMVAPLEPLPIIVMLGALKAGRIFVPLDPRDPPERLAQIREQLGAQLVSADPLGELALELDSDPSLQLDPYHPSLVYFTSGSSGRPKGTVRSHAQLTLATIAYDMASGDRFGVVVPPAFAGSITPIFGTLLSGATACLFDPIEAGTQALAAWIENAGLTVLQTSPSVLRTVADSLAARGQVSRSVRLAIVGGEVCRGEDLDAVRRVFPAAVIANHYGSSEAGFIAMTMIQPDEELARGPISFRRTSPWHVVEIVDEEGERVTAGVAGEIVVRGNEISLGYWEEPPAGEQRFFEEDGVRSVRTGDLGRLLPDGSLEHLGRSDLLVKIHGQTVDPQAVERALAGLPEIEEAVVSAVPGRDGNVRLIAHIHPAGRAWLATRELRIALSQELPPFMIPALFFPVERIPRTDRGKIDREALRQSALGAAGPAVEYLAPRTELEQTIAEIAADVLGLDEVGVRDDLFGLGADSLTTAELLSGIGERLGVDPVAADLYEGPTVESLALRFADGASSVERTVFPLYPGGSGTALFLVPGVAEGGILALRRLARRVDRPSFAFTPHGFARRGRPDRTVERAAARYVRALQGIQPAGPYLIAGYSFGALVAYEMAQLLRATGETVALLVLLDPVSSSPGLRAKVERVTQGRAGESMSRMTAARRMVRHAALWIAHGTQTVTAGILVRPPKEQSKVFVFLSLRMARRYRPRPYDGPALVLHTAGGYPLDRLDLAGRLLTGEKRVVEIPGGHITAIHEPHAGALAELVREALAEADPLTASLERTAE